MLHFTQQKSKNRIIVYAPMRPNPIHETPYLQTESVLFTEPHSSGTANTFKLSKSASIFVQAF